MYPEDLQHDKHHLEKYQAFCTLYGIEDWQQVVRLYDIFELVSFLPAHPTEVQKQTLQKVVGVTAESGYMDYKRSNNTFELIMQWQEQTDNFHHAIDFGKLNNE